MKDQLKKRMFNKRKVKTLAFLISQGVSIEVNSYALIRPTVPGILLVRYFLVLSHVSPISSM